MIHIYSDATYDEGREMAGWAYLIADKSGVLAKGQGVQHNVQSICDAEAHALLMGIFSFIISVDRSDFLVLWCDNTGVVRGIQTGKERYNHIRNHLKTYKEGPFVINYCPRRFNDYAIKVDNKCKQALQENG